MEEFFSRKDIMQRLNISRRVIEGYEKLGLIMPTKNDERGGLLYDYQTMCKTGFIRLCQKMGFKLKDIVNIIDLPKDELKTKLNEQASIIHKQMTNLCNLHKITKALTKFEDDPRNCEKIFEIFKEENK